MRNDAPELFGKKLLGFWIDGNLLTIDFTDGNAVFALCAVTAVPEVADMDVLTQKLQGSRIIGSKFDGNKTYEFTFLKWLQTITVQLRLTEEKSIEYRECGGFVDIFSTIKIEL